MRPASLRLFAMALPIGISAGLGFFFAIAITLQASPVALPTGIFLTYNRIYLYVWAMDDALFLAIERAGGQAALGALIGLRQQSIHEWTRRGRIPAGRVLDIERVTGVSRHDLRPDLYPRESA